MAKTLFVSKKSDAMKLIANQDNVTVYKYSTGKHKWHGSQLHYVGREVKATDKVFAVWVERRQDEFGPYALFMCAETQ